MTVYNVAVFGAVADGVTLCTKAVQAAVDTCHKNGGGIVQFDGFHGAPRVLYQLPQPSVR